MGKETDNECILKEKSKGKDSCKQLATISPKRGQIVYWPIVDTEGSTSKNKHKLEVSNNDSSSSNSHGNPVDPAVAAILHKGGYGGTHSSYQRSHQSGGSYKRTASSHHSSKMRSSSSSSSTHRSRSYDEEGNVVVTVTKRDGKGNVICEEKHTEMKGEKDGGEGKAGLRLVLELKKDKK